jgi:hypothetical protein
VLLPHIPSYELTIMVLHTHNLPFMITDLSTPVTTATACNFPTTYLLVHELNTVFWTALYYYSLKKFAYQYTYKLTILHLKLM